MKLKFILQITFAFAICCIFVSNTAAGNKVHTIQKGETLFRISQLYHISEQALCEQNPGLTAENFKIGNTIIIPENNQATSIAGLNCQYLHKAKKKETLFSIASKYGITVDELKAANPETQKNDYQLKKGDVLCIPFPTPTPSQNSSNTQNIVSNTEATTPQTHELSVVHACVALPFKGNSTQNNQMIEFYRGFLMAVNTLKEQGISFNISTFDTSSSSNIQNLLSNDAFSKADIIFSSPDSLQVAQLGTFAKNNGGILINPFYRWSLQTEVNPKCFTLNPTPRIQSADALKIFQSTFPNANIIYLETSMQTDAFAQLIKENYTINKLSFPNTGKEIATKIKKNMQNIILPSSSDLKTLNILLPLVSQLRTENPELDICLFGYPIWQSFVDSRINDIHAANTYFFTPFYLNRASDIYKTFAKNYADAYKQPLTTDWPPMAIYGYDCAMHFLRGIAAFGREFTTQSIYAQPIAYPFNMKRENAGSGLINHNIQVVHYKPTHTIDNITLDN